MPFFCYTKMKKEEAKELANIIVNDLELEEKLKIISKFIAEREKEKGWSRLFSNNLYEDWKNKFSSYVGIKTPFKIILQKPKLKLVDFRAKTLYPAQELLRTYLEVEMSLYNIKKLRYKTDFQTANLLYFPYLYKTGRHKGEFTKVDIKSCFYSIYSALGIDTNIKAEVDFEKKQIKVIFSGRGILNKTNSNLIKELEEHKIYRNSVYGITRFCFSLYLYPSGKIERRYIRTNCQNLDLSVSIACLLHDFVNQFKNYIVYWNIDGGIIKSEGYEKMKQYLEEHQLILKKETEAEEIEILGLGSYRIGDYETAHYTAGKTSSIPEKEYLFKVINAQKIWNWFKIGG